MTNLLSHAAHLGHGLLSVLSHHALDILTNQAVGLLVQLWASWMTGQ